MITYLGEDGDEFRQDEGEDEGDFEEEEEQDKKGGGSDEDEKYFQKLDDLTDEAKRSKEELESITGRDRKRNYSDSLKYTSTLDLLPVLKQLPADIKDRMLEYQENRRVLVLKSYLDKYFNMLPPNEQQSINSLKIHQQFPAIFNGLHEAVSQRYPTLMQHEVKDKVLHMLHDFDFPPTVAEIFEEKDRKKGGK